MPIDDLWYLRKLNADGERIPAKRHGRGKRWRVRPDGQDEGRTRLFARKSDAEQYERQLITGTVPEAPTGAPARNLAFRTYAERWRLSREPGWALETRRRIKSNLDNQLFPEFGDRLLRRITMTAVLEWLGKMIADDRPRSSIKLYFELLDAVLTAAHRDKLIPDNPCDGVRLARMLSNVAERPKWIPTEDQVLRLFDAVPERYHGALWLGSGQALRLGEALGVEGESTRCLDFAEGKLHVVQQLRYAPSTFERGFYLCRPKAGSSGSIDLDAVVAERLAVHLADFPPVEVELMDITAGRPVRRPVALLTTTRQGNPINDKTWSREWIKWRTAAGWPEAGTFHSLRHFLASILIAQHAEPREVQQMMRHKTLAMTLEIYAHLWPKRTSPRGMVGAALVAAEARRALRH
ncbi:tyrosine-type recombinase/integrase [Dactylosporangium sp. CA-092794]|uniref:tyrosine-type recombinase/integrase n=1 Tax=Dactylosporangium sp. CA-092794 TaxID=3239929 RepID=UPI003D94FA4D